MSPGDNATVASSLLRERDQKILEKFAKEKTELEHRIQKLKKANDERAKELFDALRRGDRLAHSIGFDDLYKTQIYLDSCDHSTSFKENIDRVSLLEAELTCEKKEVEILQIKLDKVGDYNKIKDELEKLKTELSNSERRHQEELKQLQERYDSLKAVKERATERYKADYKKWRAFNNWIFAENDKHHRYRNEPGISKEEKKRRDLESIMRKRQKMVEIGPDLARFEGEPEDFDASSEFCPPPIGSTEPEADKENDRAISSPLPIKKSVFVNDGSPSRPLQEIQPKGLSPNNINSPSSSPAIFFMTGRPSTSHPLHSLQSIFDPLQIKHDLDTTPVNTGSRAVKLPHVPSSSDTEEDSQAVGVPSTNPCSGKLAVFKTPAAPMASSSRPSVVCPGSSQEAVGCRDPSDAECLENAGRPPKFRRLSDNLDVFSCLQDDHGTPCASNGKKQEKTKVSLRSDNARRGGDYSAYKGRGRYGGQIENSEKAINALYAIDPKSNGGKNFPYDEVVRKKDERRKMHAGDCECCQEYYKNVGPLPSRLQQPLWRSPSKTPSSKSQGLHNSHRGHSDPPRRQADIDAHRQRISRHRQTWARAKTPPGYWEIGFPNTQEVGSINKKAREMQNKKMTEIENESNRAGGRYRKR